MKNTVLACVLAMAMVGGAMAQEQPVFNLTPQEQAIYGAATALQQNVRVKGMSLDEYKDVRKAQLQLAKATDKYEAALRETPEFAAHMQAVQQLNQLLAKRGMKLDWATGVVTELPKR